MFERLMSLLKGMFNKGMSKMETPEVLAEQAEMELEGNHKKIKEALTSGLANEKMLEQKIDKAKQDLSTWEKRAMTAVQQNNDDLAKQCLVKKQETTQQLSDLESQLVEQKKTTAMLKSKFSELDGKLKEFRMKKSSMVSRMQATEANAKATELLSGSGTSGMDKWEEKIKQKEAMGAAMRELAGHSDMDEQLKALDQAGALDDELAALKKNVAAIGTSKTSDSPKLIEVKEVSKTPADADLPMVVDVESTVVAEDNDETKK
ncbi:MAG: PspA/IM30 family protein [Candidatus Obscuribacterales bacterium]|jgi:phage shock protein A|nr:PspA/IM30 family protein [Candidatus Obscuribacterales bacterium]